MKPHTLTRLQTALILTALTLATQLLSLYIQPGVFRQTLYDIVTRPLLIPLNLLPTAVLTAVGFLLLKNAFWGAAPAALILPLLSYVNLLKIEGREDAFVPADIGLIREALDSAAGFSLNLHLWLPAVILLYTAALVTLGFFFRSPACKLLPRVAVSAAILLAFAASVKWVYADKKLYESFPVAQIYNIPFVFNTLGFNYCFLHNLNLYPVDKPQDYRAQEAEEWEKEYLQAPRESAVQPNVIFVMGESFTDITNSDVFGYTEESQNPVWRFNQLVQSERAVSGHIVVSNFGAGTANTEFDIMTGTATEMISDSTTSAFRVIHRSTPTVANVFTDDGYNAYFMHPGSAWFYNRSSVYRYFGVNDQVFSESFDEVQDKKGNLVSDEAFLRQLERDLESRQGTPQFMYTVTLQNHQTYNYEKYGFEPDLPPVNAPLSDRAREYLSVYCEGLRDTSEMIWNLAEYLDTCDTPTILVFFGDHLPNLGENYLTYRELGLSVGKNDTLEERLSQYETPFLIYCNSACAAAQDIASECAKLQGAVINDIYLGAAVCQIAGMSGKDGYVDFLNEARRLLPAFRVKEKIFLLPDGTLTDSVTEQQQDLLTKLDKWQYYRLRER